MFFWLMNEKRNELRVKVVVKYLMFRKYVCIESWVTTKKIRREKVWIYSNKVHTSAGKVETRLYFWEFLFKNPSVIWRHICSLTAKCNQQVTTGSSLNTPQNVYCTRCILIILRLTALQEIMEMNLNDNDSLCIGLARRVQIFIFNPSMKFLVEPFLVYDCITVDIIRMAR